MEMILNNLALSTGKRVSYSFEAGTIHALCGSCRREIVRAIALGSKQVLYGKSKSVVPVSYVPLKKQVNVQKTVQEELNDVLGTCEMVFDHEKVSKIFEILNIDMNILGKRICDLTFREQKALLTISALIGDSDVIILDSVEKGMHYKTRENLKKYLRTLASDYNKTIIVVTNDISFMFGFVDNYLLVDEKKHFVTGTKNDFYAPALYCCLDIPKIVEFTNYINNYKERNIKEYVELKELLKAIYRDIENKR